MLIAQVSDIHASPENDHLLRFDRVLMWLTLLRPDALVLTGDLTDGHWYEGYKQIAARLSQQSYPSFVLPGNSDDRCLMRSVWGENNWASDTPEKNLHFSHDFGSLRLTGLDSTVDIHDYGSVTDHLEWLVKQSVKLRACHHCCLCIITYLNRAYLRWMNRCAEVWVS